MKETFRKIGAAAGSALMLGTTLAGAAFAGDVSKFYTDYAVGSDGSVSSVLVVGSNAAAADVVSAIGIAAEIGQKALKETAGAGSVDLAVASTVTDGKVLEGTLFNALNQTTGLNSITLKASGEGSSTLSTLSTGTVSSGGESVKYSEVITISKIDSMKAQFASGRTVTPNSDNTNGYDESVLDIAQSGWLEYKIKFDKAVVLADLVDNAQKITFMNDDYIIASGSTSTEIKLAGAGKSATISAGEEIEFDGAKIKLTMVQKGTTVNKAIIEVTSAAGAVETKSITVGNTVTVAGLNVYVSSAGEAYAAGTQTASASLIIGGETIKLTSGSYYPEGTTDYSVSIGTDSVSNVTDITLTYAPVLTGSSALGIGVKKSLLNDLATLEYLGQETVDKKQLVVSQIIQNLDNNVSTSANKALKVTFPSKMVTTSDTAGSFDVDTMYVALDTTGSVTIGDVFVKNSSTTPSYQVYKTVGTPFDVFFDPVNYNFNTTATGELVMSDPTTFLYANKGAFVVASDKTTSAGTQAKFNLLNITGTGIPSPVNGIAYLDGSSVWKSKSGYITSTGAVVASASQSEIKIDLPTEVAKAQLRVGSTKASEEVASVAVGESATIGGVDITVKSAGAVGVEAAGIPLGIAKLDSEVTSADKNKVLVLVGGPVANSVVNDLVASGKLVEKITNDDPGEGKGKIVVVDDAFDTGKVAVVVAGSDRQGTRAAAQLLQQLSADPTRASGSSVTVQFTGAGSAPTLVN